MKCFSYALLNVYIVFVFFAPSLYFSTHTSTRASLRLFYSWIRLWPNFAFAYILFSLSLASHQVYDIVRIMVSYKDMKSMADGVRALQNCADVTIVRAKNRFSTSGVGGASKNVMNE